MDVLCLRRYGLLTMRKLIAIALLFATSQAWAAFGYYSPISINSAQVPSTQTDFPVLVSVTDARFKTVANSGHVQNANGYDIRPYTSSALSSAITGYELERYNATTGEVVMWVKVSSLSSSTTPIYLAYGDSGISTDGSSSTTWSNSFLRVLHLPNGSSLSITDSVSGLWTNIHTVTATTGQIDGAANFVTASTQSLDSGNFSLASAITYSAWINATSFPGSFNTIYGKGASSVNYAAVDITASGKLNVEVLATTSRAYNGTGSHTLSTGTWYMVSVTYDSTSGLVAYVNAASDGTVAANGAVNTANNDSFVGANFAFNCCFWNGKIDEFRLSSVARSSDWITTEYNNQSAPGTFETLGTEVAVTAASNGWFYFFP